MTFDCMYNLILRTDQSPISLDNRRSTVLLFTTARTGYVALIQGVSEQVVTRLVVPLAAGTPALSPPLHGPSVHWATYLWLCKTHER